jgi:hypothetical protein
MIEPVVRKVEPSCAECKGTEGLIGHGPRYVCTSCVRIHVRLEQVSQRPPTLPEWMRRMRGEP